VLVNAPLSDSVLLLVAAVLDMPHAANDGFLHLLQTPHNSPPMLLHLLCKVCKWTRSTCPCCQVLVQCWTCRMPQKL
jgi:hypothetical protein